MGDWCVANIAGSTLVIFEESGHCPQLEEPARCVETITAWLDKTVSV
jgi:pimeloyl-ACP methyl ester carboxylesterase